MSKRIRFDVDGEEHELVMKPFRRSMLTKLRSIDSADDTEDWGVEAFVQSIDGEDPTLSEVSTEALFVAIDFLGQSASRSTATRPVIKGKRKRKRRG